MSNPLLSFLDYDKVDVLNPEPNAQVQMQAAERRGFYLAKYPDIHALRRVHMLAKYPQIQELFQPEGTRWVWLGVTISSIIQTFIATQIHYFNWPMMLCIAYFIGALINSSQHLGLHEICHQPGVGARIFELILNLPMLIPVSATYKQFHLDHHRSLGVDQVDTDLPTEFEANLVSNPKYPYAIHCVMKTLFLMSNLVVYGVRPLLLRPENVAKIRFNWNYIANQLIQVVYTWAIWTYCGPYAVAYLFISLLFSGIHPTAGHFLGEHLYFDDNTLSNYQIDAPVETHSYYGIWNWFLYNGGYHVEHHDFANIPFHKLPELRKIAPEFYPPQMSTASWSQTLLKFIFDPKISLWNRIKRPSYGHHLVNPAKQIVDFKNKCLQMAAEKNKNNNKLVN